MNLFDNILNIKNVDFPVTLGGIFGIDCEDFFDIIRNNIEEGCTYRFVIRKNGNPLTKNGVPIESLLWSIDTPKYGDHYHHFLYDLQGILEERILESDYIKEIYAENNIIDPDTYDDDSIFEENMLEYEYSLLNLNYNLNLTLSFYKVCNE
jgi:hypothetical protein